MRSFFVIIATVLLTIPAEAFTPHARPVRRRWAAAAVQPLNVAPPMTEAPILLSDLVSATEVYAPIFGMGIILSFSGLASAFVVGSLVDGDNVSELSDQFYEKGLRDLAQDSTSPSNAKSSTKELAARGSSEEIAALPEEVYLD